MALDDSGNSFFMTVGLLNILSLRPVTAFGIFSELYMTEGGYVFAIGPLEIGIHLEAGISCRNVIRRGKKFIPVSEGKLMALLDNGTITRANLETFFTPNPPDSAFYDINNRNYMRILAQELGCDSIQRRITTRLNELTLTPSILNEWKEESKESYSSHLFCNLEKIWNDPKFRQVFLEAGTAKNFATFAVLLDSHRDKQEWVVQAMIEMFEQGLTDLPVLLCSIIDWTAIPISMTGRFCKLAEEKGITLGSGMQMLSAVLKAVEKMEASPQVDAEQIKKRVDQERAKVEAITNEFDALEKTLMTK